VSDELERMVLGPRQAVLDERELGAARALGGGELRDVLDRARRRDIGDAPALLLRFRSELVDHGVIVAALAARQEGDVDVGQVGIAVVHRRDDRDRRQRPEHQDRLEGARRRAHDAQRALEPLSQENGHGADRSKGDYIQASKGAKT